LLKRDAKECQQAFLAPLPGKQLAKVIVELFDYLYRFTKPLTLVTSPLQHSSILDVFAG
jgi:hypothetical protein